MPAFIALFTGVPYMLLSEKVQKPFAILILGMITGLIYFATGTFTIVILLSFVAACLLAELIRFCTGYGNFMIVLTVVCAIIGTFLAGKLFKKHFRKAGIVS